MIVLTRVGATFWAALLCVAGSGVIPAPAQEASPRAPRTLEELKQRAKRVKFKSDEVRWMEEIPWITSLREGQEAARQEKRPLLLWLMAGPPLEDAKHLSFPASFNTPEMSRQIRENLVPVAYNYSANADGAVADPFKKQAWIQGVSIRTPEGEVLGAINNYKKDTTHPLTFEGQAQMVKDVLEKVGPLPKRQVKPRSFREHYPDRGLGVRADGSSRVALMAALFTGNGQRMQPVVSSVVLTGEELMAFSPRGTQVGARGEVPEATVRKFANAVSAWIFAHAWRLEPQQIKTARLATEVVEAAGGRRRLRFTGTLEAPDAPAGFPASDPPSLLDGKSDVEGYAEVDAQGNPLWLFLSFEGNYQIKSRKDRKVVNSYKTAAVAEWSRTVFPSLKQDE